MDPTDIVVLRTLVLLCTQGKIPYYVFCMVGSFFFPSDNTPDFPRILAYARKMREAKNLPDGALVRCLTCDTFLRKGYLRLSCFFCRACTKRCYYCRHPIAPPSLMFLFNKNSPMHLSSFIHCTCYRYSGYVLTHRGKMEYRGDCMGGCCAGW